MHLGLVNSCLSFHVKLLEMIISESDYFLLIVKFYWCRCDLTSQCNMFHSGILVLGFPQTVRGAVLRLHPSDLHDEDEQCLPGLSVRDAYSRRVCVCSKTVPGQRSA